MDLSSCKESRSREQNPCRSCQKLPLHHLRHSKKSDGFSDFDVFAMAL